MMSENYFVDEDYGMELQSLDSQEEEARGQQFRRRGPETIILTMPAEWLDPKQPLPTDKEFHRWVSEQLRARRRGQIPPSRGLRQQSSRVVDDADNMSYGSNGSDNNSQGSGLGRAIKEASTNLFGGVLRQRRNQQQSEQVNLLLDDSFTTQQQQSRDNGVVGMELSVMS